jgi:hypothetical protein
MTEWIAGDFLPVGTEVIVTKDGRIVRVPEKPDTFRVAENLRPGDRVTTHWAHDRAIVKITETVGNPVVESA